MHVAVLEKDLENVSADVLPLTTQHTVYRDLLDDVRTDPSFHKTALQQPVAADDKNCKKSSADKTTNDTEFRKFREDIQPNTQSIQAFLDDKAKRSKALDSQRVKPLVSNTRLER